MKSLLRDIFIPIILAIVIFFSLHTILPNYVVVSSSMEPSLQAGQHLLINRAVYHFHEPERGDIIAFYPNGNRKAVPFIKRIIGLPGESVEIKQGKVYIHKENGSVLPLDEPYIKESPNHDFKGNTIPKNEYFVLGDNRNNSNDSRNGWMVKRRDIIGKAWLRIWPLGEWGTVVNYPLDEQLTSAAGE